MPKYSLLLCFFFFITGLIVAQDQSSAYDISLERIEAAEQFGTTSLDLSQLGLTEVPPEIGSLSNLRELDLSGNQLSNLPPEFGNLGNLYHLNLQYNHMSSLLPEIGNLSSLLSLGLSGNQLSNLPPEVGNLENLMWLVLSDNQLSSLPSEVGNLDHLQLLYLDGNQLSNLPPEIGNLSNLCTLDIRNNRFEEIPLELASLKTLGTQENCDYYSGSQPGLWMDASLLDTLPDEVVAGGTITILAYLDIMAQSNMLSTYQQLQTLEAAQTATSTAATAQVVASETALPMLLTENAAAAILTSTVARATEIVGQTETIAASTLIALSATATNTPPPSSPTPDPAVAVAALRLASTPMNSNAEWQRYYPNGFVQEFNGVPMVLVPAGCFQMGNDANSNRGGMDGGQQCFDEPFWIDQTEVTQADFARLGGTQATNSSFDGDNRPVENITWFEARDFCALRGGSLPTEAQWEYVARGVDALLFPWGNEWNADNAVWNRNSSRGTAEVGSIPAAASWVGALDMSGNVIEWTRSVYEDYPYDADDGREDDRGEIRNVYYPMRGGSWVDNNTDELRSASREWLKPDLRYSGLGFRCVLSYNNSES